MRDVCFQPSPLDLNCKNVTAAWSGGAYDYIRKRMLVWGGGHGDYAGNEVYAFDTEALKWERLTDPSLGDKASLTDRDPLADGNPASRHTYDGLTFRSPEPRRPGGPGRGDRGGREWIRGHLGLRPGQARMDEPERVRTLPQAGMLQFHHGLRSQYWKNRFADHLQHLVI
jgi:hypothetical protein